MRALIKIFGCLLIVAFLTSCGGGGDSGGAETLRTVQVLPPTLDKSIIDADVADCVDKNGDGFACDLSECTSSDEKVTATITVKKLPNLPSNLIASPVVIKVIELIYVPATSSSPILPNSYNTCSILINPDSSGTCDIIVISSNIKKFLAFSHDLVCSDKTYQYYVKLVFKTVEVNTNKEGTVETVLTLKLADFAEIE